MNYKNKKNINAFTLVELLVVIAIIGILSSVAVVNLNSAREKARDAAAKESLSRAISIANLCLDSDGDLNCMGSDCSGIATVPISGTDICNNSSINRWPDIEQYSWTWGVANSNTTNNTFCYEISKNGSSPYHGFRCQESGCQELNGPQGIPNPCQTL